MARVDFKTELKHLYDSSRKAFSIADASPMKFLSPHVTREGSHGEMQVRPASGLN